jgi:hypothetical protein
VTEPNVPELTETTALRIASQASDVLMRHPYTAQVLSHDGKRVSLTVERLLQDVAIRESVLLSRQQTAREFEDACTRAWMFLRGELDRRAPRRREL